MNGERARNSKSKTREVLVIYIKMSKVAPKTPENDTTKVCEMYKIERNKKYTLCKIENLTIEKWVQAVSILIQVGTALQIFRVWPTAVRGLLRIQSFVLQKIKLVADFCTAGQGVGVAREIQRRRPKRFRPNNREIALRQTFGNTPGLFARCRVCVYVCTRS